jgi:hypothetical protein
MSKIEGAVIVQNQNHVKTSAALNQITAQLKAINGPKAIAQQASSMRRVTLDLFSHSPYMNMTI